MSRWSGANSLGPGSACLCDWGTDKNFTLLWPMNISNIGNRRHLRRRRMKIPPNVERSGNSSGREVGTTAAFASYWAMCEHSWWYLNTRPGYHLALRTGHIKHILLTYLVSSVTDLGSSLGLDELTL